MARRRDVLHGESRRSKGEGQGGRSGAGRLTLRQLPRHLIYGERCGFSPVKTEEKDGLERLEGKMVMGIGVEGFWAQLRMEIAGTWGGKEY